VFAYVCRPHAHHFTRRIQWLFASSPSPRLTHEGLDNGKATRLAQGASSSVAQGPPQQGQGQVDCMACDHHFTFPCRIQTPQIRAYQGPVCKSSFAPSRLFKQQRLTWLQRVKKWFYHHGKSQSQSKRLTATVPALLAKPSRKLVPLTPPQAYSLLFCQRGSALYKELHRAWKLYRAADEVTVDAYEHLFPTTHNPKLPFVTFQQAIFKDKITVATEEELNAIQEFIDARFEKDTQLRERPWEALKVDDLQEDVELERNYVKE